jgi:phosphoglycolate phosphatase
VRFDSIIWDWNGTLLNDVEVAINSINRLLYDRNLVPLTLERYLDVFTFPVQDYYEVIGFDLINEPFEIPASSL